MFKQHHIRTYLYKACPRCRGDLVLDADVEQGATIDGRVDYVCLQCGRGTSLEAGGATKTPVASRAA